MDGDTKALIAIVVFFVLLAAFVIWLDLQDYGVEPSPDPEKMTCRFVWLGMSGMPWCDVRASGG